MVRKATSGKAGKQNKLPLRVPPEIPEELRNWVIDNMVAINRGTLTENLAMEFI